MTPGHESEVGRCIFREAHDAILIVQPGSLRVVDANPSAQRISGYRRKQLLDLTLQELMESANAEDFSTLSRACESTSCFVSKDGYHLKTVAGARVPIHLSISRIHTEPEPMGLLIARDITKQTQAEEERRKLELQMQQSQRLESLGVMAGGVAHDFNNLLTGILGNAELAGFNLPEDAPMRAHLDQIIVTTHRAADLVRQLLAYSGHARTQMKPLRLAQLVREITQLLRVSTSRNVVMNYRLDPEGPVCKGDPVQLSQVIMNLVVNAAEAIGSKPGIVTLATRVQHCDRALLGSCYLDDQLPEGSYACLEVTDTGCGMDSATLARIFEPFFTTKFVGRGLGLSAVLGIIRGHQGAIQIESAPGKGCTFRVYIPTTDEPVPAPVRPVPSDVAWRGGGWVLVVDDEKSVRLAARELLERLGFQVALANDGEEGLQTYVQKAKLVRAVLVDWAMPRMNGTEMARELRKLGAKLPVIITSGFDENVAMKTFEPGEITAFLQKPYSSEELRALLSKSLPSWNA